MKSRRENSEREAKRLRRRLSLIVEVIEGCENRAMAVDGPVSKTTEEMTEEELRQIYRLATGQKSKR